MRIVKNMARYLSEDVFKDKLNGKFTMAIYIQLKWNLLETPCVYRLLRNDLEIDIIASL